MSVERESTPEQVVEEENYPAKIGPSPGMISYWSIDTISESTRPRRRLQKRRPTDT